MTRLRAVLSAAFLFVGVVGMLVPMGVAVFDNRIHATLFGAGVTGGAGWLAWGSYRSSRPES